MPAIVILQQWTEDFSVTSLHFYRHSYSIINLIPQSQDLLAFCYKDTLNTKNVELGGVVQESEAHQLGAVNHSNHLLLLHHTHKVFGDKPTKLNS